MSEKRPAQKGICPVCQKEYMGRNGKQTCGDPYCAGVHWRSKKEMCECGRGWKLTPRRGCESCESTDAHNAAVVANRFKVAMEREQARVREEYGLIGYLERWMRRENANRGITYRDVMNTLCP